MWGSSWCSSRCSRVDWRWGHSRQRAAARKPPRPRNGVAVSATPRHDRAMQLQLDDVALFVRIVELGTLSAAARERNAPVSQVTRALARLEAACGARLLHRSTHGLSLTDEGTTVLNHGRSLLTTTAELQGELSGKRGGPAGWVRVSVSAVLAQAVIAPSL